VTIIHTQAGLGEAFFMGALPSPAEVKAQVERRLHAINAEMSTYLPGSTISQFNQLRDDRWFLLPPAYRTKWRLF